MFELVPVDGVLGSVSLLSYELVFTVRYCRHCVHLKKYVFYYLLPGLFNILVLRDLPPNTKLNIQHLSIYIINWKLNTTYCFYILKVFKKNVFYFFFYFKLYFYNFFK